MRRRIEHDQVEAYLPCMSFCFGVNSFFLFCFIFPGFSYFIYLHPIAFDSFADLYLLEYWRVQYETPDENLEVLTKTMEPLQKRLFLKNQNEILSNEVRNLYDSRPDIYQYFTTRLLIPPPTVWLWLCRMLSLFLSFFFFCLFFSFLFLFVIYFIIVLFYSVVYPLTP
jgi:hypothetical protein